MNTKQKPLFFIVIGIVAVAFLGLGGFWFWSQKGQQINFPQSFVPGAKELSSAEVEESLGSQILEQIQNPLKGKLPPTNPFENAKTNPLEDVYQNPF